MKRIVGLTLFLLVSGLYFETVCAETHRIEFLREVSVNGVQLKPGKYKLNLNGTQEAEILDGRKLLTTAKFEIVPLGGAVPNSILQTTTGEVKEIRLKKNRIVLIGPPRKLQALR